MTIHTKSSENKKPKNAKKPIFTRKYCEYFRSISDIAELIETCYDANNAHGRLSLPFWINN